MTFALLLVVVGGFLLGGAWSVWRLDGEDEVRTPMRTLLAVLLLVAALLATTSGILRLI